MTGQTAQDRPGPVVFDVTGTQTPGYRGRGISRYVTELALALEAVAPDRVGVYAMNPDFAVPAGMEPLVAGGKLWPADEVVFGPGSVLHVASPYELSVPLRRLWPEAARRAGTRLVVTLYDLIPEVMAEDYVADPGLRQRYRARHLLVQAADAVLALSDATARDGIERLGLDPGRVTVVGAGVSSRFRVAGPASPAGPAAVEGLRSPFVLYTGGSDPRKNVGGLLAAWGRLPDRLRTSHQLVVVCSLAPSERHHFDVLAARAGVADDVLLTGFVDDHTLTRLYQTTDLFVFPSRYEGYGLPVAEALACGAPVVASDRSCLPELVPPAALFDPDDPDDIARAIAAGLDDGPTRRALLAHTGRAPHTWADVAAATAAVYDRLTVKRSRPRRTVNGAPPAGGDRLRLAFVSPLPPEPSGVADYSALLLEQLRPLADVTAFVDGPPHHRADQRAAVTPAGVERHPVAALEQAEALIGPYDAVVYSVGNSEFHTGALAALQRRPGVVLAHDVRLTDLYRYAPHQHPRALAARGPDAFYATLHATYPDLPPDLGAGGGLTSAEADHHGILMARDVIAAATHFIATSNYAATLARLDARPADRHKVAVIPLAFGVHAPPPGPPPDGPPLLASYGLVNARKQTGTLLEAFAIVAAAHPDARLAVVGPAGEAEVAALRARIAGLGLERRVELTGRVDPEDYGAWLRRTTVAVQLRDDTNGETSGAVGACLAAGVPTVVTAIGPARELAPGSVVPLPPLAPPEQVAAAIDELLRHPERRLALRRAAQAQAAERSFERTARRLVDFLVAAQAPAGESADSSASYRPRTASHR